MYVYGFSSEWSLSSTHHLLELLLEALDLSLNNVGGSLPSEIGWVSELEILNMEITGLAGTLPTTFGLLTNLRSLDFEATAITGTIPSEIGRLTNLGENHTDCCKASLCEMQPYLPHLTQDGFCFFRCFTVKLDVVVTSLTGHVPTEVCQLLQTGALPGLYTDCTVYCSCCGGCF
jgi:hypothetical protein